MNDTTEYRVEGNGSDGWILFDRTSDERAAFMLLGMWRRARDGMDFRLVKITTTVTREVMQGV